MSKKYIRLYTKVFEHTFNNNPFHPKNADWEFGEYLVWTNKNKCRMSFGGMKEGVSIIELKCQIIGKVK